MTAWMHYDANPALIVRTGCLGLVVALRA